MALFKRNSKKNNKTEGKRQPNQPFIPRDFDREERIALQKMVTNIPVTRKMLSQQVLARAVFDFIGRNVRMGATAANIVNTTVFPQLFFTNLQLLEDCTRRVSELEPYWKFDGKLPSQQLSEIQEMKHDIIGAFIERSFYDIIDKVKKKRSLRAKQKLFDSYQTALLQFQDYIDEDNQKFFKELCENSEILKK